LVPLLKDKAKSNQVSIDKG